MYSHGLFTTTKYLERYAVHDKIFDRNYIVTIRNESSKITDVTIDIGTFEGFPCEISHFRMDAIVVDADVIWEHIYKVIHEYNKQREENK